jgi:hypothetical protein
MALALGGFTLLVSAIVTGAPVTLLMADQEWFAIAQRLFMLGALAASAGVVLGLAAWGSRGARTHRRGRAALTLSALTLLACAVFGVIYRRS